MPYLSFFVSVFIQILDTPATTDKAVLPVKKIISSILTEESFPECSLSNNKDGIKQTRNPTRGNAIGGVPIGSVPNQLGDDFARVKSIIDKLR